MPSAVNSADGLLGFFIREAFVNRSEFLEFSKDKIVILDGATGSALISAGMPDGACTEQWVLDNPEKLLDLQKGYIEAGCDIIYAPTFGANAIRLRSHKLEDQVERFNTEGVKLSKSIAGSALVAGDISMSGDTLEPYGDLEYEELVDVYKQQIACLDKAGCDLLVAETIMDLNEAKAVLDAARDVTDLAVMVTLTFEASGRTMFGAAPEDAAKELFDMGAAAVGANCSAGPEQMAPLIEKMAAAVDIPVIAKPNAGKPLPSLGKGIKYDIDAGSFAIMMTRLVDAGANIIGGCCGTNPEYMRQVVQLCDNMTFRSKF